MASTEAARAGSRPRPAGPAKLRLAGIVRRRWSLVVVPAVAALGWALYARWRLGWPPSQMEELSPAPLWGYVDAYQRGLPNDEGHRSSELEPWRGVAWRGQRVPSEPG